MRRRAPTSGPRRLQPVTVSRHHKLCWRRDTPQLPVSRHSHAFLGDFWTDAAWSSWEQRRERCMCAQVRLRLREVCAYKMAICHIFFRNMAGNMARVRDRVRVRVRVRVGLG